MIDALLLELDTVIVPCDPVVAEPTETEVEVTGISVVTVLALVSTEVVNVAVEGAVTGDVVLVLVEVVEAA